ncbi:uncharacterized protein EI90DRAFT_1765027 [Cantharellus anzutake]|uniref:uncharacterized protein n=1 Tax=Cantharellus anzutake TaxID=1750568 RepID=UPI001908B133|nr:uncharacterized protein EI90DRAFT_1765027 [Cantharellus anzutake]KAF8327543.1 hypothetical protein EI90DRAFT_1765027 [Cantharellus anzutake]
MSKPQSPGGFSRLFKLRDSSGTPNDPSHALPRPVPDIQVTPPTAGGTARRDHDRYEESRVGLPTTTINSSSRAKPFWGHIMPKLPWRNADRPGTSNHRQSAPLQPSPTGLPVSPPRSKRNTNTPSERTIHDNAGDRRKTIIKATKIVLQTAASALKFSPIPNLDQIPNMLLAWLQIYETIADNDENLKELDGEVRKARETIFQPLQLWNGPIPPEIDDLIRQFTFN